MLVHGIDLDAQMLSNGLGTRRAALRAWGATITAYRIAESGTVIRLGSWP